jgi:ubiquinone/menaquinone biosynthesis C-methylase UbiE
MNETKEFPMPSDPTNSYMLDPDNIAETLRLTRLDEVITDCMGGLFPEHPDLANVKGALDVACGPGAWATELAYQYPTMQVTGIDISKTLIPYAQAMAKVQQLDNVRFLVMDATKLLDFPDDSFDLVNARFMIGFMKKDDWPRVVKEFARITRPGGIIRLIENEDAGISNSAALEKISHLFTRAAYQTGRSLSPYPETAHFGITPMLETFLREAGCEAIQKKAHVLDFSAGAKAHFSHYENYKIGGKLGQPFLLKAGVATQKELDTLYEQEMADMLSDSFRGLFYFLSVWGRKPIRDLQV